MEDSIQIAGLTPKQQAFITAFCECGKVTEAAKAAGVSRFTHRDWLESGEPYRKAFAAAEQAAARNLEDEAYRRAHDGVRRPVLYQGQQVTVKNPETGEDELLWEHEYSDTLLTHLLKGLKPDRYRDNAKLEVTGADGSPLFQNICVIVLDALKPYPDARQAVAQRLLELEAQDVTDEEIAGEVKALLPK